MAITITLTDKEASAIVHEFGGDVPSIMLNAITLKADRRILKRRIEVSIIKKIEEAKHSLNIHEVMMQEEKDG